jgi:ribosome-associated translation inhibitor RaiA
MLVRLTTDNHIRASEALKGELEKEIESKLRRFVPQLTRVEVHLADENSSKHSDNDKTCTLEARLAGLQPLAATANGAQIDQAVNGALDKLIALLEHKLGRLGERKGRPAYGDEMAE